MVSSINFFNLSKLNFLVYDRPLEIPALTSDILTTRYRLHRKIVEKTENFYWLMDTGYHVTPDVHPLDLPESKTVQLKSAGNIIITRPSINRLASVESTLYCGSRKDWISPLASFSLVNPEKCRRLVRFTCYNYLLILFLVCLHWFISVETFVLLRCGCFNAQVSI